MSQTPIICGLCRYETTDLEVMTDHMQEEHPVLEAVSTPLSEESLRENPFICPETNSEHRIGQNYDERRGTGNGPQICLNCKETLKDLIIAERQAWGEYIINTPDPTELMPKMKKKLDELVTQSNKDLLERVRSELDDIERRNTRKTSRPQISKDTETRGEHYSRTQGFKSAILVARSALQKIEESL